MVSVWNRSTYTAVIIPFVELGIYTDGFYVSLFPEHTLKAVKDILRKLATHIRQEA